MTDEDLRARARRAAAGDAGAGARSLAERRRLGTLSTARLEIAAYAGDPAARLVLGAERPVCACLMMGKKHGRECPLSGKLVSDTKDAFRIPGAFWRWIRHLQPEREVLALAADAIQRFIPPTRSAWHRRDLRSAAYVDEDPGGLGSQIADLARTVVEKKCATEEQIVRAIRDAVVPWALADGRPSPGDADTAELVLRTGAQLALLRERLTIPRAPAARALRVRDHRIARIEKQDEPLPREAARRLHRIVAERHGVAHLRRLLDGEPLTWPLPAPLETLRAFLSGAPIIDDDGIPRRRR